MENNDLFYSQSEGESINNMELIQLYKIQKINLIYQNKKLKKEKKKYECLIEKEHNINNNINNHININVNDYQY